MPGVFTVFNIGTKHARNETNSTIAKLYRDCLGRNKFINDGPGTGGTGLSNLAGNAQGRSMDPKVAAAVAAILEAAPTTVNLVGHSRGAVMCHMIANDLAASTHPAAQGVREVNMVLLDPVNMSVHVQRGGKIRAGVKLGSYVAIVMENVTVPIFPSKTVKPAAAHFRGSMNYLHVPGTHGSGTQPLTSAIGKATFLTMQRCLYTWNTHFTTGLPMPKDVCEAYAGIHLENPVRYDSKGLVSARLISDDPKGQSTRPQDLAVKSDWKDVSKGRVKAIAANYEAMTKARIPGENLLNSPYFFNSFHLSTFSEAFPAIYAFFTRAGHDRSAIDREVREIEGQYPNIAASFRRLGMI